MDEKEIEFPITTPSDDNFQISKEDFSKLSYRQKFTVTEYGYLLSVEDAEVVGKMLGSITKEKDILAYCQSKGKKVLNFDKSLATTDTVKYWPIIGLLVGLDPTIFIAFGGSGGWLGFVGSFCFGSLGIPSALLGAYIGKRSKSNTWIGAFLGMIPGAGLSIIIVFILFCCL